VTTPTAAKPGIGLGAATINFTAGNTTYFATLFVDSQDNLPVLNQAIIEVSPSTTAVPAQGATISFLVITPSTNTYGITATDAFVSAGPGGTGTGVATVTLAKNTGAARTTTIEFGSQPITLTQAGP
jgi:hypothetical protein